MAQSGSVHVFHLAGHSDDLANNVGELDFLVAPVATPARVNILNQCILDVVSSSRSTRIKDFGDGVCANLTMTRVVQHQIAEGS